MICSIASRNKTVLTQTEIAAGNSHKSLFPACLKSEIEILIGSILVLDVFLKISQHLINGLSAMAKYT